MRACRELERKFGLQQVADKRRELLEPYLKKADYRDGDVKRQIGNILKSVFSSYRFQSFGEYSALLSCFNIEAKQVKGEHDGAPYNGIVYAITDDSGRPVSTPVKSSLIGKRFGYEGIQKRYGVWSSPEPLATNYASFSPFAYCKGDPVNYIDPDGKLVIFYKWHA